MARPKKERPNRADGTYEVKVTIGHDMHGKPIRKSFYSSISKADARARAEAFKRDQEIAMITGESLVSSAMTFEKWAIQWLETYKKDSVKLHTYLFTYDANVRKYLVPYFGKAKLDRIKQIDIQKYFNTVKSDDGSPLAKSTLSKHKMILKSIFDAAVDNDYCAKNPVKNITIPESKKSETRPVYTAEQAETVKKFSREMQYWDILIMLHTGIRRSELIGLQWDDINLESRVIHIRRAVVQTKGEIVIGAPKTETSDRLIPFSEQLAETFRMMPHKGTYVIGTDSPLSPATFAHDFKRRMQKIHDQTGAPILTPHELRHTYGTLLRESGADIYTIQKVMGHSDISVTAGIYVHNDIEVLRRNLNL